MFVVSGLFLLWCIPGRSPIIAHTNTAVNGMATIRACKAENSVSNEFDLLQDVNTSAYYIFAASTRALSLWLDTVCLVYMAAVILIFLLLGKGELLLLFVVFACVA